MFKNSSIRKKLIAGIILGGINPQPHRRHVHRIQLTPVDV